MHPISKSIYTIKSHEYFFRARQLLLSSFLMFLMAVYSYNYANIGILFFSIGGMLNLLVMTANGGFMPVDMKVAKFCFNLLSDEEVREKIYQINLRTRTHKIADESTKLRILIDRLDYRGDINSIGDVLIECGCILIAIQLSYALIIKLMPTLLK